MRRQTTATAMAVAMAAALAGCGGPQEAGSTPQTTTTVTVTAGSTGEAATPSNATTGLGTTDSPAASDPTSTGAVPAPGRITLQTFYRPDPQVWTENFYDVADRRQQQAVRGEVPFPCTYNPPRELEIRTGSRYRRVRFSVGQDLESRTSTHTLTVRFLADNKQVEMKTVPANKVQPFDRDVTGVTAVRVQFDVDLLDGEHECGSEAPLNVVLFDGTLE